MIWVIREHRIWHICPSGRIYLFILVKKSSPWHRAQVPESNCRNSLYLRTASSTGLFTLSDLGVLMNEIGTSPTIMQLAGLWVGWKERRWQFGQGRWEKGMVRDPSPFASPFQALAPAYFSPLLFSRCSLNPVTKCKHHRAENCSVERPFTLCAVSGSCSELVRFGKSHLFHPQLETSLWNIGFHTARVLSGWGLKRFHVGVLPIFLFLPQGHWESYSLPWLHRQSTSLATSIKGLLCARHSTCHLPSMKLQDGFFFLLLTYGGTEIQEWK